MVTNTRLMTTANTLRDTDDALAYMTECTLATVSDLAGKSRPPKNELSRQISIAQTGIDWVMTFLAAGERCGCGRVQDIIEEGISVQVWADRIVEEVQARKAG